MRDKSYSNKFRQKYLYSQAFRKEGWVDKQVQRGRMSTNLANALKTIMPALEAVYPGQWDIQFTLEVVVRPHANLYSLVEFDYGYYDYILYTHGRRNERGEREHMSEEDFEHRLSTDRYTRSTYLKDCFPTLVNTRFEVVQRYKFHSFKVHIHFPEVTIRNSLEQSITVRDLFFRFKFMSDGSLEQELHGAKTTFTVDEFESGYIHSHIPTNSLYNWEPEDLQAKSRIEFSKVCLGSGEMKMLMLNYREEPDTDGFQMVLLMLRTVASWESVEGGPHHRMENVITKQVGAPLLSWQHGDSVFKQIINARGIDRFPLDWSYANGRYNIIDNEKLEDFCLACYRYEKIPFDYMVHKDETGAYYVPNRTTPENMEPGPHDYLVFRGTKYTLKVEGELRLSGDRKKYINPNIKNYVKRKLETAANQVQIKADSISRLHKANNNQGVSRQSEILM